MANKEDLMQTIEDAKKRMEQSGYKEGEDLVDKAEAYERQVLKNKEQYDFYKEQYDNATAALYRKNGQDFLNTIAVIKKEGKFKYGPNIIKELGSKLFSSGKSRQLNQETLDNERSNLLSNLGDELKNLAILNDVSWNSFSNSEKRVVLDLVKDIDDLSKINSGVDHVQDVAKIISANGLEAITQLGEEAHVLASLSEFSNNNLKDMLLQLDNFNIVPGKLVPSKDDLDIVTALKMTGIDLQFNGTKWELNKTPGEKSAVSFVPTKDGKPLQVFGNDNIQFLLNNYLNVPQDQRTQIVVPNKLLQVYVNEYERQMMEGKDPGSLEVGIIRQDVARQRRLFSMDSNAFEITKLLDNDTMLRNAQKMAIVNNFNEIVDRENILNRTKETIDFVENNNIMAIGSDPAYRKLKNNLYKLVDALDNKRNKFEDITEFDDYDVDFAQEYDLQIDYLKRSNADSKVINALENAKQQFIEMAVVQQVYWKSQLADMANAGSIFSDGLANVINESMGFAVKQNEGGDFVMANGEAIQKFLESKNISSELYEKLKERARDKANTTFENKEVDNAVNDNIDKNKSYMKYPQIFFNVADMSGVDFSQESNLVVDYSNMRFYQSMWQEGCLFYINYMAFKKDNPDATIDDYVEYFAENDEEHIFNPDLIKDSYCLAYPKNVLEEDKKRVQSRMDLFNKQLLITDLILKSFTPVELAKYNDMPDNVKDEFLAEKYASAIKSLSELEKDPVGYKEALDKAKKRHEAGVVGSVINQKWSEAKVADNEKGQGPLISSAVEAFLEAQAKNQERNNAELAAAGEPIVDNGEKNAEKGNTTKDQKDPKYGDLFPSGPDVNKFLKKMKPYSAKALIKCFIDPLLKSLDSVKINMKAYYEKVENSSRVNYTNEIINNFEENTDENNNNVEIENDNNITNPQEIEEQKNVVKITQRDFEASAFMPGAIALERMANESDANPNTRKLAYLFKILSSTPFK